MSNDNQIIVRLQQKADALFKINEPQEADFLKIKMCLKGIVKKLVKNFDYNDVFLTYLKILQNYKKKLHKSSSIFNDIFVDLTSICGAVLSVNLWCYFGYFVKFLNTWISLTTFVPDSLKIEAFRKYSGHFERMVFIMKQIGNINIQNLMFELIIHYSCNKFDKNSRPVIIKIFKSNGLLNIENALAEFDFQMLKQSMRLFLNKFNTNAENYVTSVLAECITIKAESLQLADFNSFWVDFNQGTQSISFTFTIDEIQISFFYEDVSEVHLESLESGTKLILKYVLQNPPNVQSIGFKRHLSKIKTIEITFLQSTENFKLMTSLFPKLFPPKMYLDETTYSDLNYKNIYMRSAGIFFDETEIDLYDGESQDDQKRQTISEAVASEPSVAKSPINKVDIHENMIQEESQLNNQIPEVYDDIEIDISENSRLNEIDVQLLHDNSFSQLLMDVDLTLFDDIEVNEDFVLENDSKTSPNLASQSTQKQAEPLIQPLSLNLDKAKESENIENSDTNNNWPVLKIRNFSPLERQDEDSKEFEFEEPHKHIHIQKEGKSVNKKPKDRKGDDSLKIKPSISLDELKRNANKTTSSPYQRFVKNEQQMKPNRKRRINADRSKNTSRKRKIVIPMEVNGFRSDSRSDEFDDDINGQYKRKT